MATDSKYIVQDYSTARCPVCGGRARMLVREDGTIRAHSPAFYICPNAMCGYVGQIGVGRVPRLTHPHQ